MSVQLEIRDGSPNWWDSPDIWVVPGTDPTGSPGSPIAGSPAFLWAHVTNNGKTPVTAARVDFWWADPSAQVLRSTASFIGSANVDLDGGASADVLCLAPWSVSFVNGGHECVVAVTSYPGSSVPTPPPDDFNPPAYPEVAQRNLGVLLADMLDIAHLVQIAAGPRAGKTVGVAIKAGGELGERALLRLGLKGFRPTRARIEVGLGRSPHCMPKDGRLGPTELDLEVAPGRRSGVYAAVRAELPEHEYGLVEVRETDGKATLGGYTFVVVGPGQERTRR